MAKILCVLYPDAVNGYPKSYARDAVPTISHYDNGQTAPTPKHIDFVPGHLLGSISGELPTEVPRRFRAYLHRDL
jgi:formate dehydrogenase